MTNDFAISIGMSDACLAALRAQLGRDVTVGDEIPPRHERDLVSHENVRPLALVRPRNPESVAAVIRICAAHSVPVVPQGGLTGLSGGAQPVPGCVVLSLERLIGIEEIDVAGCTMTVRAGTPLEVVQKAALDAGLYFGLDLGARGSCAIGGNIATNAGGNAVLRYGTTRAMVLGLEVVLADGTLMTSLNKLLKNNTGYDLKQLFIGSEGTLGVVTRAVLRLMPLPKSTFTAICALADYAAVLELLAAARRTIGPFLSAFEVMWQDFFDFATDRVPGIRRPIEGRHEFFVLIKAQGNDPATDTERFETWLGQQFEAGIVEDGVIARSLADEESFWAVRDAGASFGQVIGEYATFDIGLPTGTMDEFARICRANLEKEIPGCHSQFFGHIADGNLHVNAYVPDALEQPYEAFDEIIYGLVREFAGNISAEHGIGHKKKRFLSYSRSPEEIALMRTLKYALDPKGILNPGKIF